jgi:hypothetical protein
MFVDANEAKVQTQALQKESDAGQAPSLEQIAEFQRLSLRRTEVAMELLTIFKKLNLNTEPNVVVEEKLKSISNQLTEVEKGLGEITAHLQAATQTQ